MDLSLILEQTKNAVAQAAVFIKKHYASVSYDQIEVKEHNSLVSFVDKGAEKILVEELSKIIPNSGFWTEEDTPNDLDKELIWIIDPLDGTTNFLHHIPYFSVSVALWNKTDLIVGVIQDVMIGDVFSAAKDEGAFLNGDRMHIRNVGLSHSLVATGFPYTNEYPVDAHFEIIKNWLMRGRGMRRFGSAALDLCYVAASRTQAYYESTLNAWDLAAGILIVKEAGGIVSDYKGKQKMLTEGHIIAANPELYPEVLKVISDQDIF